MTKQQLRELFVDGHKVTGQDFTNLINSLKAMQTAVSDPSASGTSSTFIATISQNTEGKITVTKKTVDLSKYQNNDLQQKGDIKVDGTGVDLDITIEHNMGHYPTARVIDDSGKELVHGVGYGVAHTSTDEVVIILYGSYNTPGAVYSYILD